MKNTWKYLPIVLGIALMTLFITRSQIMAATDFVKNTPDRADSLAKIDPLVLEEIASGGETGFFIWMTAKADLSPANDLKTKLEKGQFVYETLRATADSSQQTLRSELDAQSINYRPFYIANKIYVYAGSEALVLSLAARPDVAKITPNRQFQLDEPIINSNPPEHVTAIEPNISFIKSPQVWTLGFHGEGMVLAGNDTGLMWNHPAIINQYRGWNGSTANHNYNWWDATGAYPAVPGDGHGHGTHTTGTMVGDDGGTNQIGVAPGAQTIHCKNMTDSGSGSDLTFSTCFEWDLAPWNLAGSNPRPDLAPHAINNSWGYSGGNAPQFEDEVNALQAAGIVVEVSAGNEGSSCSTLRSPGDYVQVLTTGSVSHAGGVLPGTLTGFSSRGPSALYPGQYFPDIMAPGENIRSSVPGGGYQGGWSGTSMSGPHTAALIALMWQAAPGFEGMVEETYEVIRQTAVPLTGVTGSNCGGDYTTGPNNDWGFGTIDALAAVEEAMRLDTPYRLTATPTSQDVCYPAALSYMVDVIQNEPGFTEAVTLSAAGQPPNYDASFSVNPVIPPGTSALTFTNSGVSSPGAYAINIVGIALTHTVTTTVNANLFTELPGSMTLTSPADGATNVDLSPTFDWAGATQAGSYYLEVATDNAFNDIIYTATTQSTTYQATAVLDPLSTYYWRVTPSNACGGGSVSAVYSFTTRDIPPILLVDDDDNGPDVRSRYTDILDNLGLFYDIWDTNNSDNEPTATNLAPYSMVIWFTGDEFGGAAGPGAAGEAALGSWLDGGKCLFLSSQDYHYDRGLTSFMQTYLGVASMTNDNGDYTSVTGQGVVFSGLGPYPLTYPFTDFSDPVNPDATAEVAFVGNNSNNAAINKDSGVYRTTFWAFPFEAMTVAAREEALQVAVDWCGTGAVTGTLDGNVSSAVTALGIQGATVTAVDGGYQRTVSTNAAGDYNMTVPVGTYNVTAAATNYVSATITSVVVLTNTVTTVDFVLDGSVLTYSPSFIEETMEIGAVVSNTVTVTNTGPLPIDWQASISNYGGPVRLIPLTVTPLAGEATGAPNPALSSAGQVAATASQPVAPFADVNLVLDDGTRENAIGLTNGGQFIWLNRFTPAAGDFPFTLTEVQVLFGAAVGVNVGELVDIYVYEDTDGDGNPGTGANFLGSILNATVQATNDTTWSVYPVTTPIVLNGPGDVLIAVVNRTAGTDPSEFPAAIDQTPPSAGRSWVGAYTAGNPGNPPALPADSLWGTIDSFGLAGNWMVRGYGNFGAGSGAWASAVPDSGTIPANSTATFAVVFDATSLYQTGDYTAELSFSGTFVNEPPIMPLTMHLGCSTCGFLEGEITDDRTGDPLSASIHITGPGGFDVTLSGDSYSNIAVQPGSYTIDVSANGYFPDSATVAVTQGVTTVTDFALVPEYGELVYSPAFVEEFMSVGDVVSNTITVTNIGTIPFDFTVNIGNYGGPTLQLRPVTISIPRFEGTLPTSAVPPTTARAPQAPDKATNGEAYPMAPLGEMAYALDVYPGLNLVMFPDADVPGAWTNVASVPQFHPAGDFVGSDFSKLYAIDYDTNQFVSIDTTSGARTIIGTAVGNGSWSGMTGAVDGTLYVVSTVCGTSSTLFTINPTNAVLTQIGSIGAGTCIIDIAINANGEMYGVDIVSDVLYQINPATGAGTVVGPLGVNANYAQGMDFEQVSGILYWAAYTTSGEMRVIDTSTGASALVGAFPGGAEVDALAFATGGGGAGGWAYPVPNSGTVPAGSSVTFELVFDATSLLQVGTYTAELSFSGDFENTPPVMPLTMHLDCPTCGFIDGSITDAFTGDPLVADIHVTGSGGVDVSVTGDSYYFSLPADTYDITVTAAGYFDEMATVVVTQGVTVTTDFAMTPIFSELAYAPASYEVTIGLGTMLTETLAISNMGTIAFDFALSDVETGNPGMGRFYSPATTCPADAFGYTCTDSTEPDGLISYDFEDISGTGTSVTLGDDQVSAALPVQFAFDYYGTEYSDIYISSNGFLTVLSGSPNGCCTGGILPSTTTPNGVIAGWWEDLNPGSGGTIHYQTLGDEPHRYMIVQFTNVPHFGGGNLVTMQYKLFEGSNNIEVHYQAAPSDGGTHSAGIENETGTIGLQYYRGTSALTTPLAVCYLYPGQYACGSGGVDAPWLVETPDAGTIEAGETVLVNLLFDATVITQTGTYTAELYFNGTFDNAVMPATVVMHVEAPVAAIGLSVTVGTEAGVCGTTDTLEVASGTAVYYCYTVTNIGNVMLPSHTITDTVFGHIDTFIYNLMPGESESVIYPQTITADAASTARWTASHTDLGLSAMAEDTVTVTVEVVVPPSYSVYLPFIIKP